MIQLQMLNYIIDTGDVSIIVLNSLTSEYFPDYKAEFEFINEHLEKYGNICDKETFIHKFKDFKFIEVLESRKYLIDALQDEYVYNKAVPIFKEVNRYFVEEENSKKAVDYLFSQMPELSKKFQVETVDLFANADLRFQTYVEKSENKQKYFISTGLKELDDIIGGWDAKEELAIVTARTNQGKSWWLFYFLFAAAKEGRTVGLYSGEMSPEKVGYRIDTFFSGLSNFALTRGNVHIHEDYEESIKKIKQLPGKFIVITPNMLGGQATPNDLRTFCIQHKIEMLGIDQYSLMKDNKGSKIRFERYENISMDLKNLQTELQIPIISNVQIGRGVEKGADADTENLQGADKIAQDATTILFIDRKDPNTVIRIGKARDAVVGSKLTFNWDIDKGRILYIPTTDDGIEGKGIEDVKKSYQDSEEPF